MKDVTADAASDAALLTPVTVSVIGSIGGGYPKVRLYRSTNLLPTIYGDTGATIEDSAHRVPLQVSCHHQAGSHLEVIVLRWLSGKGWCRQFLPPPILPAFAWTSCGFRDQPLLTTLFRSLPFLFLLPVFPFIIKFTIVRAYLGSSFFCFLKSRVSACFHNYLTTINHYLYYC